MTKTINAYTPDRGEVGITISADDVTAFADFTTAEDILIDGVVRKLEESSPRTREFSEVYVTAENAPIKTMSAKQTSSQWTLTIVDDYSKGDAGEWGTDLLSAVEILEVFFNGATAIDTMTATPAGSTAGMIETTLTNVDVQSITHPPIDADANAPNEVVINLIVESFAKAVHA